MKDAALENDWEILNNVAEVNGFELQKLVLKLKSIQQIFLRTLEKKQVMMFSVTVMAERRVDCKRFTSELREIWANEKLRLALHGLSRHYVRLGEEKKKRRWNDCLGALDMLLVRVDMDEKKVYENLVKEDWKVPNVQTMEVMRQVPAPEIQVSEREMPQNEVQHIEKIVEVPVVIGFEINEQIVE